MQAETQLKKIVLALSDQVKSLQAVRQLPQKIIKGDRGEKGDQGEKGDFVAGRDGRDGRDGVGITDVKLEAGNTLAFWVGDQKRIAGTIKTIHGKDGRNGKDGKSIKGDQGEKGDQGQSIKGDKGEKGEQGPKGEKGDKGPKGDSVESLELEKNVLYAYIAGNRQRVGSIDIPKSVQTQIAGGGGSLRIQLAELYRRKHAKTEILVQDPSELNQELRSDVVYRIDGRFNLAGASIVVPAGGLTIEGYGADISLLEDSTENAKVFISPEGGSGILNILNIGLRTTGEGGQIFDIEDATGFNSIEMNAVNFYDTSSIGDIRGYRQFFANALGLFGVKDGFWPAGFWRGGFRIAASIARNCGENFYIIQEGDDLSFTSRVQIEMNIDLPAGSTSGLITLRPENFINDCTLQLDGCQVTRAGQYNLLDPAYKPFMSHTDPKSLFRNNTGVRNTRPGTSWILASPVATSIEVFTPVKMAGFTSPAYEIHFTNQDDLGGDIFNAPEYIVGLPDQFEIIASLNFKGNSGDEAIILINIVRDDSPGFIPIANANIELIPTPKGEGIASINLNTVYELKKGDRVEVWASAPEAIDLTLWLGSSLSIKRI